MHPNYLGFQVDWPVFVKMPFTSFGKPWKKRQHFDWQNQINPDPAKISILYSAGYIHHNEVLEVETKVGDRLGEMNTEQLTSLVRLMNNHVKKVTSTVTEYNKKKCKQSLVDDRQRGLIRSFLRNNAYIMDIFYETRDKLLKD